MAYVPTGQFTEMDPDSLGQLVRVNVQGPVTTVRALVPAMCERDDDRRCEEKYGELWHRYREKVPRRIIPHVY